MHRTSLATFPPGKVSLSLPHRPKSDTGQAIVLQMGKFNLNSSYRSLLKQHLHVHREKVPCRRFMCSQEGCQFTGRSAGEVKRHFGTHSTEKKHHCSSCSYQGKTWESLKRHQKIHAKEIRKELKCPDCEYTTSNSSHMTRHSRIHSGIKPFKCPHCPYSTYTSDNLSKHLLKTKLHRQEDK
uniref:C2H2-type domain-containing protein n=1 Tax=Phlebotomus papatasi TaxID=29031 RepID=A0A1B0DN75_PHLPP